MEDSLGERTRYQMLAIAFGAARHLLYDTSPLQHCRTYLTFYMQILDVRQEVDSEALASFIAQCQFKFGGIAKAPGARPGMFHKEM